MKHSMKPSLYFNTDYDLTRYSLDFITVLIILPLNHVT